MKKTFWFGILLGLFFCLPYPAIAATTYSFKGSYQTSSVNVTSPSSVDISVTFAPPATFWYVPEVCIATSQAVPCDGTANTQTIYDTGANQKTAIAKVINKPVVWTYTQKNLNPAKTYYLVFASAYGQSHSVDSADEFFTGTEKLLDKPAILTSPDGNNVIVSATISPTKYPYYQELSASLVYSTNADLTSPVAGGALTGRKGPKAGDGAGVNQDSSPGTFYWNLGNLAPTTIYYFQITVTSQLGDHISSDINSFNSSNGAFIPSSQTTNPNLNTNGYTLLSGFPGLTFLPDPGLCAQERAAAALGKGKAPQICDINDLLNYAMKLLIGLSGVFLVFRLMYEGFVYMTSDMPFKISSSKNAIINSLLGLLLALSAYLILNTINPKLVANTINVQQLAINTAGFDGLGTIGTGAASSNSDTTWARSQGRKSTLILRNGSTVVVTPCDESQMQKITVFGHSGVEVQKNLVASIQRISKKWEQTNPQYPINTIEGYNCRTIASSAKLSYHAYGLAVDVNADTNAVNTTGNMPASFIKLWTDEGWGWGGNWSSYKDPMHFSKGNSGSSSNGEQGNLQGE